MDPRKEAWAVGVAFVSLALGLGIAWVVTTCLGWKEPGTAFLSLLLLPLVVYMAVSGRITELSGPGGLQAKFRQFGDERADASAELIDESVSQMEEVVKEGMQALAPRLRRLDPSRPHNLVLRVGRDRFAVEALKVYLNKLAQSPSFKFVLLVDEAGKLIGYGPHWQISSVLGDRELSQEFVRMLNEADIEGLKRSPALRTIALPTGTSNLDALQAMAKDRVEALVVTDEAGKPTGLVERDQIIPKLLLALSESK